MTKRCTKCKNELSIDLFHKDRSRTDGRFPQCKTCVKENTTSWYQRNKDRRKSDVVQYRRQHPDKRRKWRKTYELKHRDVLVNKRHRRLARLKQAKIETVHRSVVLKRDNFRCHYCDKLLTELTAVLEHKTPISRGGEHSYQNCVASCASCNNRKGAKTEEEYKQWLEAVSITTT